MGNGCIAESSAQCSMMTERGGVGGWWQGDPGGVG